MSSADFAAAADADAAVDAGAGASVPMAGAGRTGPVTILAAYICRTCDIQGRDAEVSPGEVLCWNCGVPALITARVAG